jgi:hypothetical protein
VQYDRCDHPDVPTMGWCGLCTLLGCDPKRECPTGLVDGPPDAGSGSDSNGKDPKGCCETGRGTVSPALVALAMLVGMMLFRSRRHSA